MYANIVIAVNENNMLSEIVLKTYKLPENLNDDEANEKFRFYEKFSSI